MTRQFFKILWNNRRRNILVFIELFMISLVLANITVYLVNMLTVYGIKNCYDTSNVVLLQINKKSDENKDLAEQAFIRLKTTLASNPIVESVSYSDNAVPYVYNSWIDEFRHDSTRFYLGIRSVDIDYAKVMDIKPLKGRWFDETDYGKEVKPILISVDSDIEDFDGKALGQRVIFGEKEWEIIGVTERFKRSDIEAPQKFAFIFKDSIKAVESWGTCFLIKTKENHTADLLAVAENQVYSTLNPDSWTISSLNSLENMRSGQNSESNQRNYLTVVLALFIILNIFLGTIGILWYNTNLRIHEIGVRRAVGATGKKIRYQLIAESMVIALTSLSIVIAILVQTPVIFGNGETEPGVISKSILISSLAMILLVLLSTWLPAKLASRIKPASALKTE